METMIKYSSLLNVNHGLQDKVCLKMLYNFQILTIISGTTKVIRILLSTPNLPRKTRKTTSDLINKIINGKTSKTTSGIIRKINHNHHKEIGSKITNGGGLHNGLTKILVMDNFRLQSNKL